MRRIEGRGEVLLHKKLVRVQERCTPHCDCESRAAARLNVERRPLLSADSIFSDCRDRIQKLQLYSSRVKKTRQQTASIGMQANIAQYKRQQSAELLEMVSRGTWKLDFIEKVFFFP